MSSREFRTTLIQAGQAWAKHGVPRHSAALSFYAMLSLAPILVIAVTVSAVFLDSQSIRASLEAEVGASLGKGAAGLIASIIDQASSPGTSVTATAIAFVAGMLAGSGLFLQLKDSVDAIWETSPPPTAIPYLLKNKFVSVVSLLVFLSLVLTWLTADSVLGWFARSSSHFLYWPIISFCATTIFATFVFAIAFKGFPQGKVLWREVWPGAFVASVGFSIAKLLLSLYLSYSGVAAAYGSAGALLVILLWVYYSSQVFFYGVEITRIVALRRQPKVPHVHLQS